MVNRVSTGFDGQYKQKKTAKASWKAPGGFLPIINARILKCAGVIDKLTVVFKEIQRNVRENSVG